MEDVLEVYHRPYDPQRPVLCFDESPRQLIGVCRPGFTDAQGVAYQDYEYTREGTADLLMLVEPLGGRRAVHVRAQHTRLDFAEAMAYVAEEMYPTVEKVTVILANLAAHKRAALYERYPPERARAIADRLEFVFTPKHGSWLNIAEIELSVLTRQGLKDRVASQAALEQQVTAWYAQRNAQHSRVDWQFTTQDARIKLKRLYPSFIT